MIDDLDLEALRKRKRIGYYFRYSVHRNNFYDLMIDKQVYGHYTAKPLYGKLTPEGRVDRSAGFNGDIAVLFVPLAARDAEDVELFITHTIPENLVLPGGKRNWKKINEIAEASIAKRLKEK